MTVRELQDRLAQMPPEADVTVDVSPGDLAIIEMGYLTVRSARSASREKVSAYVHSGEIVERAGRRVIVILET